MRTREKVGLLDADAVHNVVSKQVTPTTVLVPLLNLGMAGDMLSLAATLASGSLSSETWADALNFKQRPRVVVLGAVEVPAGQPLTMGLELARSYRALLDFLPSEVEVDGRVVRVEHVVKVARDVASAVHQAAIEEQAGTVLFHWKGYARHPKRHTYGQILDAVLRNPPCLVVLARPEGWRDSRRVLLPVRGGPSAEQALNVALMVAERLGLPLAVMHDVPPSLPAAAHPQVDPLAAQLGLVPAPGATPQATSRVEALGEEPYIVFNQHLNSLAATSTVPIEQFLTRSGDMATELFARTVSSDMVVMGGSLPSPEHESMDTDSEDRPLPLQVAEKKGPPLLVVRAPEPLDLADYKSKVHAGRVKKLWADMPFEHWFVENTYHGDEFKDSDEFLRAKEASGLSLSVALLTFNDARHIRSIITGLRRVLLELHPVADQIAVIDAGSSDGTAEIARSLGVEVYQANEILAEQGSLHGYGESWWKSLAVLHGDVVVWLDAKARHFHPSAVLSLAGPLLKVPALQLVKGFSQHSSLEHEGRRKRGAGGDLLAPRHNETEWGAPVLPQRGENGTLLPRPRVQALKPTDLLALSPQQLAEVPPQTILKVLSPALSGVIAPFGRDMAARRSAMLEVPAFIGNNLEVGLLLSLAAEYGTRAIAQVELKLAHVAAPPEPSLQNSIEITQVLARRLHDPAMRRCAAQLAERMVEGIEAGAGSPGDAEVFEVRELGPVERPPIDGLASSRKARNGHHHRK